MRRLLAFVLLSVAAASAYAVPTVEDVQHAVHRADYAAAQSMLHEVIAAHPDNARAHYMLSELLAHDGKLPEAKKEAAEAQRLDPAIHFTSPERFKEYLSELNGGGVRPITARRNAETPVAPPRSGGSSVMWILLLLIGGGVVLMLMRRRPNDVPPGYGGYGNSGGVPPNPNGPYPPGYPGTGYPPGYGQAPGSGMGGRVAAGLGGLAAGMVAEHLLEEALDHRHGNANAADFNDRGLPPSNPLEDRPIDFGNGSNDWNDNSSGGGDSGGGDSGGGFDSGSGSDWS